VYSKPAGSGLFGAHPWASQLLARLGRAVDPRESTRWTASVLVFLVLVPPFVLAALSGTAWGNAADIPFVRDVDALAPTRSPLCWSSCPCSSSLRAASA
jgi:hypothetical protein